MKTRLESRFYEYMDWLGRSKNIDSLEKKLWREGWDERDAGAEKVVYSNKEFPFVVKMSIGVNGYENGVAKEYKIWKRLPTNWRRHFARYYGKLYSRSSFEIGFQEYIPTIKKNRFVWKLKKEERRMIEKAINRFKLDEDVMCQAVRIKGRGIVFYDYSLDYIGFVDDYYGY